MLSNDPTTAPQADGPPFDAGAFRRCLGQFATGVTVVTAQVGSERVGMTANSFSSLSLDPPLIMWAIRKESPSFALFRSASHFAVNVLGESQIHVSQTFSRPNPGRFSQVAWTPGLHGSPLIGGVIATFECATDTQIERGDHFIIVGRVLCFAHYPGHGLLFAQGRYGIVDEHPAAADNLKRCDRHWFFPTRRVNAWLFQR